MIYMDHKTKHKMQSNLRCPPKASGISSRMASIILGPLEYSRCAVAFEGVEKHKTVNKEMKQSRICSVVNLMYTVTMAN